MTMSAEFTRSGRRVALAALLALTCCGAAATASTANLITNGGFEDGATGFASSFGLVAGIPAAGDYTVNGGIAPLAPTQGSLAMFVSPSHDIVFQRIWGQDIAVTAGTTYRIAGDVGTWATGVSAGSFRVVFGGALIGDVTAPETLGWAGFSFLHTATSSGTFSLDLVESASTAGTGDYALDALAMSAVPLPAGLPLLAAALAGLALRRKRGMTGGPGAGATGAARAAAITGFTWRAAAF